MNKTKEILKADLEKEEPIRLTDRNNKNVLYLTKKEHDKPSDLKNTDNLYAFSTKSVKINDGENINDDLGNDLKKLVPYTDYLVKYAKNLKEFTSIIQEMNNQQKQLDRVNDLIESSDLFELLKPETNQKQDSNISIQKYIRLRAKSQL